MSVYQKPHDKKPHTSKWARCSKAPWSKWKGVQKPHGQNYRVFKSLMVKIDGCSKAPRRVVKSPTQGIQKPHGQKPHV